MTVNQTNMLLIVVCVRPSNNCGAPTWQATRNGADLWLSYWVQRTRRHGGGAAMARRLQSAAVPHLAQPSNLMMALSTAPGSAHEACSHAPSTRSHIAC